MRMFTRFAAIALIAIIAAACGGSSKSTPTPTPEPPKDETAFAQSMVLDSTDFPPSWNYTAPTPDQNNPLEQTCGKIAEVGKTGRAESGDFSEMVSPKLS